ncbi:hypothetical protein PAP_09465 [Palaeococcus pacificus DY20341]|uniref:Flavodoxin-like domain-containing protein n=1 Tax=Palaeococcus pacificus DY20341 TaxID=1343739 RepID=A0A075LVA7_9EURY|nr:flavodoxin domain-containing protein [Palaeococcus pacificus]AIF70269.1 hypothetical protein PAP_09465 [Palaeococcus pacificus DY20341]
MSNRICIVYDTKRGSTEMIVKWMEEAIKGKAEVKVMRVSEVDSLRGCNLVVIGSPIYYERPLKSVLKFLEEHRDELRDKKVAVFVVCLAELFGHFTKGYIEKYYLGPILKKVPAKVVKAGIMRGWLAKPDFNQKENIQKWINDVLSASFYSNGVGC